MDAAPTGPVAFRTTRWSLVRDVRADPPSARAALEDLCRAYWAPLYAFLRRRGTPPAEAEDLVQGFFLRALEKDWMAQADPERGRFRTFLLAALRHFVANERAHDAAAKRGGGRTPEPLAFCDEERGLGTEPRATETPEQAFQRRYAEQVLERALARLAEGERGASDDRRDRFEALRPFLAGGGPAQRPAAEALGLSETAFRVALHRLRVRLREAVRTEVAETLDDPSQVDDEIGHLIAALRRP